MSPAETSSALNATARFFSPKLMFPFIYNLDGGDGGFMRHCGELLVTKVREGQTNQWGPPKWFGCLWMREASFCFSVVFPDSISPPCPLFFCCLLCHDLYPLVFFLTWSLYTLLSSLLFFKDKIRTHVFYILHWSHECWYSPCCSSSLLIQVLSIEAGCSVLKQRHPANNPPLFNLWILQTIYSKNAHHYVFLICYGSKRRHPGLIQCSTP